MHKKYIRLIDLKSVMLFFKLEKIELLKDKVTIFRVIKSLV